MKSTPETSGRWLHRHAVLTAVATLVLICLGGLVTSKGVGMAVPDWPTSYGYNMFLLPLDRWWRVGGIHDEHLHRLVASGVGFLTIVLAVWTQIVERRSWVRKLAWGALALVLAQGLLGGLRVVLDRQQVFNTTLGTVFGLIHACAAQLFFLTVCAVAVVTSRWWRGFAPAPISRPVPGSAGVVGITALIVVQLLVAATMRHQHAGLAIPDFPLAYGRLWPATDPATLELISQRRIDIFHDEPVTAFQIHLQMVHRLLALVILGGVVAHGWSLWRQRSNHRAPGVLGAIWAGLLVAQCGLGAATIWTNKAADVATAHVAVGALSLSCGAMLALVLMRLRREQVPEVGPCRAAGDFLQPPAAPVVAPGVSSR